MYPTHTAQPTPLTTLDPNHQNHLLTQTPHNPQTHRRQSPPLKQSLQITNVMPQNILSIYRGELNIRPGCNLFIIKPFHFPKQCILSCSAYPTPVQYSLFIYTWLITRLVHLQVCKYWGTGFCKIVLPWTPARETTCFSLPTLWAQGSVPLQWVPIWVALCDSRTSWQRIASYQNSVGWHIRSGIWILVSLAWYTTWHPSPHHLDHSKYQLISN